MSVFRKDTLVVDFSGLPKRPDAGQVQQFLEKKVKLKLADTKTIQLHNLRNCVYVETIDSDTALRYEIANNYKHTIACNNKEFKIPVYVDSEAVTVRVHDLPTHMPHVTVTNFMQQYGVVISIARERWRNYFPGYYNGVRVLRMKLSREIPSTVVIEGEQTLVSYRPKTSHQPKTCPHCGEAAHPKRKCAKTPIPPSNDKALTPSPAAAAAESKTNRSSCAQLDGNEYLSPTPKEGAIEQSNKNNTDTDDDDDDGDDEDGGGGGSDGNDCSDMDTDGFVEASQRKRRMAKSELSSKTNETKKKCVSQNSQKSDHNSNRFNALVEIDPICPSPVELNDYLNRYKDKNRACNSSS